jgi:RimJ/RimL family protein N-acetyltransferase
MNSFDFAKDYILETNVALLRPLKIADFEHLLPFSLNETGIWQYSLMHAIGEDGLRNYLLAAQEARKANKQYAFIVFDKRTQQYAGSTRFYDIELVNSCLKLGYTWYGKAFQQTGLNRHCKYLLFEFAFETMQMERIELRADTNNERSIHAMKNIGCVVEGELRSNVIRLDGNRRNTLVLSILRHEWLEKVKPLLQAQLERKR